KMQDISKGDGRTVLFVSHNMAAVKSLCTRAIVLEHGRTVFEGGTDEAVDFYLSVNKNHSESIIERTDRKGNQKLQIKTISFLNNKNEFINEVISGESLKVKIEIHKNLSVNYDRLFLAINFLDTNFNFALSYTNDEMGVSLHELAKNNFIELEIPNFYLRAGTYNLRVLITENDTRVENFVDLIENAAIINVMAGDLWKTGKLNRKGSTAVFPGKDRKSVV